MGDIPIWPASGTLRECYRLAFACVSLALPLSSPTHHFFHCTPSHGDLSCRGPLGPPLLKYFVRSLQCRLASPSNPRDYPASDFHRATKTRQDEATSNERITGPHGLHRRKATRRTYRDPVHLLQRVHRMPPANSMEGSLSLGAS